jgi:hypothetical protein
MISLWMITACGSSGDVCAKAEGPAHTYCDEVDLITHLIDEALIQYEAREIAQAAQIIDEAFLTWEASAIDAQVLQTDINWYRAFESRFIALRGLMWRGVEKQQINNSANNVKKDLQQALTIATRGK